MIERLFIFLGAPSLDELHAKADEKGCVVRSVERGPDGSYRGICEWLDELSPAPAQEARP